MADVVDVEQLLERLGIEVTSRSGGKCGARCPSPDHEDKTPSWYIRDEPDDYERHGRHHCYGCGWGGYPVHLVERVLGLDRDESRDWLRSSATAAPPKLDLEVEFEEPDRHGRFRLPPGVVLAPIAQWVTPARRYAVEDRGLTAADVDRWGLGYAVDGRLAGRLVFPIKDARGATVSYAARDYTGRSLRKYLAPKTSEGASKAAVFGEHLWGGDRDCLVLVEGPLDAVAVARLQYKYDAATHEVHHYNVGAVQGSDWTPAHLLKLRGWRTILLASDNDLAGNKLADAIREQVGADRGATTRVGLVEIPGDEDCSSLPAFALDSLLRLAVRLAV